MELPTLDLVQKAKRGDKEAWAGLVRRFYDEWLNKFHANIGTTLRRNVGDTADLVQSALGDALSALPSLRNEAVFFTWMTAIIRHKISAWRRQIRRKEAELGTSVESPPVGDDKESIYLETLDAIISLFPDHPEEMAVLVWKNLDECSMVDIASRLGVSETSARNRLRDGITQLKKQLPHE